MATYHEKKKLWEGRRRLPNGKRVSAYGATEEEAEINVDFKAGIVRIDVTEIGTVREFIRLNVWPKYGRKESATRDQAKWAINSFILPSIGDLQCGELQPYHCEAVLDHVVYGDRWNAQGFWEQGKERSTSTGRTVRKHLFKIVRLLARQRLIPYNYLEEIDALAENARKPVLGIRQVRMLWESCKARPMGPVVFLAGFLGARRGEVLGVTTEDVADTLLLADQRVYERGKGVKDKKKLKTDGSPRELPLPDPHKKILEGYAKNRRHLCVGEDQRPLHPTSIRKMLIRECELAGVPVCTLHSLRATVISDLREMGCPEPIVDAIVGHGKKSVNDGYTRINPAPIKKWILALWKQSSTAPGVDLGVRPSSSRTPKGLRIESKSEWWRLGDSNP
jgi:integrase